MILSIKTVCQDATDLGYLLHKNPAARNEVPLSFGKAQVFYPVASDEACQATLLVEVDPIALVRGRGYSDSSFALKQYVNDRPYAASSFMSVAIASVFGTALNGRCSRRPELVERIFPLEINLPALTCSSDDLLQRVFGPLGYEISARRLPLDERFPEWGPSRYVDVTLRRDSVVQAALAHLYILLPVLDQDKHYWVGEDEVEKLLAKGGDWLPRHPEKEFIAKRYLKYRSYLSNDALLRLAHVEDVGPEPDDDDSEPVESAKKESLHDTRLAAVAAAIKSSGARSVLDLGCGEGRLIARLLDDTDAERILGIDVSLRSLQVATERLRLDRMPERKRRRVELAHGSLLYRDQRLEGFDAAAIVEVIEHLDASRLEAMERVVFEFARPAQAFVTTPNPEYNVKYEALAPGAFRHKDHRFEWTRDEFQQWASSVADRFGYDVLCSALGPADAAVGAPSQLAVFKRKE